MYCVFSLSLIEQEDGMFSFDRISKQKNEMLLEIAEDLPDIEADKLKVKLACG